MLYQQLEEKLYHARIALKRATGENLVELCKRYLALLAEYRSQLYELQGASAIHKRSASSESPENLAGITKAIRAVIEKNTKELRTEMLLLSLTTVSCYEAVEIFNRQKYAGHDNWEIRASGVKFTGVSGGDLMTIQEAVDLAGLLLREEHLAPNTIQAF
jgi:hypothetical protein